MARIQLRNCAFSIVGGSPGQSITFKIGEGNLTYTVHKDTKFVLDRGDLDFVCEGDQVPMDVAVEASYDHFRTGSGEAITPEDALLRVGSAASWTSTGATGTTMYAVNLVVVYTPPCSGVQLETITFPYFFFDSMEFNIKEATLALKVRCNATYPTVTRS